ncbi:ferredoxin [Rhodopirellula sp.]|nr:ferredoxin [Rhodopirellula sp.]
MTHDVKPHPLNVIGDFYVEDGCCTACDVPQTEAPELFGMADKPYYHCYVKRQPKSEPEQDQMLSAIACAELQCIHYRGIDPAIISRLSAMDQMEICDTTPPPGTELGLRTHVTFATNQTPDLPILTSSFKAFLKTQRGEYSRISFSWFASASNTVRYKRNDRRWRNVFFEICDDRVHVSHDAADDTGVSWYIHRWLMTLDGLSDIRWYTEDGWQNSGVWHHSHY